MGIVAKTFNLKAKPFSDERFEFSLPVELEFMKHCRYIQKVVSILRASGTSEKEIRDFVYRSCWYK